MISFSYGILLFFFCFPLCLLFLFLSFLPSFWLCCGSSWFSHILTKSVDDFVLAGGELGQTQTLNSVAGEGQKVRFQFSALSRPPSYFESAPCIHCSELRDLGKVYAENLRLLCWDSLLTLQHQNLWFFRPERQQIF